ncbi:MAG: PaaI family thioesterase [Proteobacteria bacterium]|jgi:acyl-coenzyme A thioesterase 13|nr:PaaI family thioesterase [Pseudomonadota bacterium]MDA1300953.1 PaaI family thioesterase [Pseudomonadota bacterium]
MDLPEGYQTDPAHDPAEDHIGPFYYRPGNGTYEYAFRAAPRHCNVMGIVHGGVLMTFADYAACIEATANYDTEDCVTISFDCQFLASGQVGDLIEARVRLTGKTGSMVFATGDVFVGDQVVLTFSSVMKRLRRSS